MGKLFTPEPLNSGFNSNANLVANFEAIEEALDKVLSRTGESPNQMDAHIDMNGFNLINTEEIDAQTINTQDILIGGGRIASLEQLQELLASLTPDPLVINANYTVNDEDKFRAIIVEGEADITLPSAEDIEPGFYCHFQKATEDSVTFSPGLGITIQSVDDSTEILELWGWVSAIKLSADEWALVGNLA